MFRAGLRHRPTRPRPRAPRFRGPTLSKVKEMCRHSYSLSHEKSEKCFGLLPSLSRTVSGINGDFRRKSPNFPTPVYSIYSPAGIGYWPRASQSFNPALIVLHVDNRICGLAADRIVEKSAHVCSMSGASGTTAVT